MGMTDFLGGRSGPSAKVTDGRLVLSLPDADVPVVWILDLEDTASAVLRLEQDGKTGHYTIKKHHGGKTTAETVASYASRKGAEKALQVAASALEKSRETRYRNAASGQPVVIRPASRIGRFFTFFLYLWVAAYLLFGLLNFIGGYNVAVDPAALQQLQSMQGSTQTGGQPASRQLNGVPQSADEFLKNNNTVRLP